jgi:hypothetical protein
MAISHEVFVAPPALLELLIAADQSQTDAYVASNDGADDSDESSADETWFEGDALLDALLELNGTEDVVDMWRLGDDVGTLLNVPLGYDDVFWAMGRSLYDMTYIEPSLVAEFSRRLRHSGDSRDQHLVAAAPTRDGRPEPGRGGPHSPRRRTRRGIDHLALGLVP